MEMISTFGERIRNETFAERLNARMFELRISKSALANACGISAPAITFYLTKQRRPNGATLVLLARRLNTSVDYLLGLTDDPTPPQTSIAGDMILTNHAFANQLKTCMDASNMKQADLEAKTGISQSRISMYLSGHGVPDIEGLIEFAKALNVTTDFLLGNTIEMLIQTKEQVIAETFSERMKRLLCVRNISQKEFSEQTGIVECAVSRYVNGARTPSGEILIKIAEKLDTTTDYLLCLTDNPLTASEILMATEIYQKLSLLSPNELGAVNTIIDQFINTRKECSSSYE